MTDTVLQNKGGFEAALGLHKNFDDWGKKLEDQNVRGCNGNYIGIREKAVYERIKHVVVKAGDIVVWDEVRSLGSRGRESDGGECVGTVLVVWAMIIDTLY